MTATDRSASKMVRLIAEKDWSQTPVGAAENWSPALRTIVSMLLANRFPLLLWWGPDYIQFYNDAYRPIPGAKHPNSLGQPARECWPEIWHILKPLIDTPFHGGPPTWIEDFELEPHRSEFPEETHFTVAYSPVPDDTAPSGIGGVLATVHEITTKVIGERRLSLLRELATRATQGRTAEEACSIAAEIFSQYPKDLPFSILYLMDNEHKHARLVGFAGVPSKEAAAHPASPSSIDLSQDLADPWSPFANLAVRQNSIALVDNLHSRLNDVPPGPWSDPPRMAIIVPIPAAKSGHVRGFLISGISARLEFDENYRTFFQLIAAQIATAISNAEAYEEERRRAEALAKIDRAKTTFFSNVSHEFRTPLTLMLGPLQDLLSRGGADLSTTAQEQLELVNRNGARLLRLVNTLLDFSRIEAGRVQAVYEPTDLAPFTAELASVFRSATERAGLRLTVDCRDLGERVYVDRDMWEKVVLNLLSNAFKFTFDGEIAITMVRVDDSAELRVRDTGVGIPAEAMPRLFERFHRIPNTRSRTHEGTGIGLALVQELIKLHGGSIGVESTVDQGTTFIVTLPFGQDHLPKDQIGGSRTLSSTSVGAQPFLQEALRWLPDSSEIIESSDQDAVLQVPSTPRSELRARILVVDDNADMRQYLARLLAKDYAVETAADGKSALSKITEHLPDLVLSDIMMPEFDGFELLNRLRSNETTRSIPVVLLSARAGEESRVEGLQAGADDYLVKPFSARELLARIGARLEIARLRRETEAQLRANQAELERKVEERTTELSDASQQLRELSARILQAQDEERRRLARELHDGVGQLLAAASIEVANVVALTDPTSGVEKSISNLESMIRQVNQDIRTMSYLLYPPLLDEIGLKSALEEYVYGFARRSRIEVSLRISENLARLERGLELCLFRIVQESLTNVLRHAESATAAIEIGRDDAALTLVVRDHGKGMSAEKFAEIQAKGFGVGIRGMRERVRHFGGEMAFTSDSSGTTVFVAVPISKTDAQPQATEPVQSAA
jgi:signal transduction histidine kinase